MFEAADATRVCTGSAMNIDFLSATFSTAMSQSSSNNFTHPDRRGRVAC